MTEEERALCRHRALGRAQAFSHAHREAQDGLHCAIRAARRAGASWQELHVETGLGIGKLRGICR